MDLISKGKIGNSERKSEKILNILTWIQLEVSFDSEFFRIEHRQYNTMEHRLVLLVSEITFRLYVYEWPGHWVLLFSTWHLQIRNHTTVQSILVHLTGRAIENEKKVLNVGVVVVVFVVRRTISIFTRNLWPQWTQVSETVVPVGNEYLQSLFFWNFTPRGCIDIISHPTHWYTIDTLLE